MFLKNVHWGGVLAGGDEVMAHRYRRARCKVELRVAEFLDLITELCIGLDFDEIVARHRERQHLYSRISRERRNNRSFSRERIEAFVNRYGLVPGFDVTVFKKNCRRGSRNSTLFM